jgi:hypothetical protein
MFLACTSKLTLIQLAPFLVLFANKDLTTLQDMISNWYLHLQHVYGQYKHFYCKPNLTTRAQGIEIQTLQCLGYITLGFISLFQLPNIKQLIL